MSGFEAQAGQAKVEALPDGSRYRRHREGIHVVRGSGDEVSFVGLVPYTLNPI